MDTPSFSSPFSLYSGVDSTQTRISTRRRGLHLSTLLRRSLYAFFMCIFASVGSLIGAMVVVLGGREENTGFVHGVGVGALSGAILSMEMLDSSVEFLLARPSQSRGTLPLLINFFSGSISRKRVQEQVIQAISASLPVGQIASLSEDGHDLFSHGVASRGLPWSMVERIENFKLNSINMDSSTCSICLQDFVLGEYAKKLPVCSHVFHPRCVDAWLVRHGSCPLCRQSVGECM